MGLSQGPGIKDDLVTIFSYRSNLKGQQFARVMTELERVQRLIVSYTRGPRFSQIKGT